MIFADASGEGFGSSLWLYGTNRVETEHGLWTREYGSRSSNYRELYNLVLRLEALVRDGTVPGGTEVYMFTDNSTAESAFYRGTSSPKLLFELVLRTKKLEMEGHVFVRVVWVAGTRMIEQGTDGLSRGDLMTGVMAGANMLLYVPLNKSVVDRQDDVIQWLKECARRHTWKLLKIHEWFDEAFEAGNFIWAPPPAIADIAVDLMCEARHIRTHTAHIFVCPAPMTNRWRKKLGKIADFVFTVPVGSSLWSKSQHEPLIVAFVCPFCVVYLGGSKEPTSYWTEWKGNCMACGHPVQPLSGICCANYGNSRGTSRVCQGIWHAACYKQSEYDKFPVYEAADLDDALLDGELHGEMEDDDKRFQEARTGDDLMNCFQCDDCAFYNMQEGTLSWNTTRTHC